MDIFKEFDKNNQNKTTLTEQEAWFGILFLCGTTDGDISDIEMDFLSKSLHNKEKFIGLDLVPLLKKSFGLKGNLGQLKFLELCCNSINDEDNGTVFCLAVDLILVDGILHPAEKHIIELLAKKMNLEPEYYNKIIEVMIIKNKGNTKSIA